MHSESFYKDGLSGLSPEDRFRDYAPTWIITDEDNAFQLQPGDNTLNLAIRCGSTTWPGWLGTLPFFAPSASFSEQLICDMLKSVNAQLLFLETHLTPTNNWHLAQADALLLAGFCFPEL